jgi:hypothetical protein
VVADPVRRISPSQFLPAASFFSVLTVTMDTMPSMLKGYPAACRRIEDYVSDLARDMGVTVTVEVDPDHSEEVVTSTHSIGLSLGRHRHVVAIDHRSFVENDEYVGNFVLPQIQAAVEEMASRG